MPVGTAALTVLLVAWVASSPAVAQFETRAAFLAHSGAYSLAVGDFNRDGILDVAEVNANPTGSVEILLGNRDGTFRLGTTYAVAIFPHYAATTSLRKNGILDLVFNDKLGDNVWVMLGNGDGTFQAAVAYPTTAESYMVGVGAFRNAGEVDIVAPRGDRHQGKSLLLR